MSIIRNSVLSSLLLGSIALTSTTADAAGFYIQEQSVKGLGSAFAGSVTSLEDASTVYFNPAGMTKLDGMQINAGAHLLIPSASLNDTGTTGGPITVGTNDGNDPYSATPVPNFFAAMPIMDDRAWVGIGVTAPFGLANDYSDGWFGRFDSTETDLTTINISPALAIEATEWLSIGGGIDIQFAEAELKSTVSNVVSEGTSSLKGKDWSLGYNVGIQIEPMEGTEIGAHYRSAISHTLDGNIRLQGLTAGNFDLNGTADLDLPDIATFGITQEVNDRLRVSGQATWFGWNNFEEIRAVSDAGTTISNVRQNYQTTWAFAVGAEYDVSDTWTVRAGYQHDSTPTTDEYRTTRTPDGDRNWFSTGATYKIAPNLDLDLAATYIDIADEEINLTRNSGLVNLRADTEGSVGILALGFTYKF
ncbi:MAG: outer membrane protein transport protein [Alphaproteobacteria bacterium]|nr:outer membrane protein transport protein [Alphaproteobacteria bacterium]